MTVQQLHDVMGELRQMIGQVQDNMQAEMIKMKEDLQRQIAAAKEDILQQIELSKLELQSGVVTNVKTTHKIHMKFEGVQDYRGYTVITDPVYIPLWGSYVRGWVALDEESDSMEFAIRSYKDRSDTDRYYMDEESGSKTFDVSLGTVCSDGGSEEGSGAGVGVLKEVKDETWSDSGDFELGKFEAAELTERGCLKDDKLAVVFSMTAKRPPKVYSMETLSINIE